jgi:hypothetical protein
MPADREADYRVLERTVDIHSALTEAQYVEIHRLLGDSPGRSMVWSHGYLFDLLHAPDPERVLTYLQHQYLSHTVAEERRWTPEVHAGP